MIHFENFGENACSVSIHEACHDDDILSVCRSDFAADVMITQGQGCSYTYRPDDFAG